MSEQRTNLAGVAFGLALASFAAFQQFKLPPIMPLLLERFAYDRVLAGGFMSVYALAGLITTIAIARWVARRGPYPALWLAMALYLAGNLTTWAAPAEGWLVLIARGAEGIAFAASAVIGPATANSNASQRHLPMVIGLTAAWIPLGQIAATLLAQPALASGQWQLLWYAAIAGTLLFSLWIGSLQMRRSATLGGPGKGGPIASAATTASLTGAERRALWVAGAAFLLFSGQYFAYMTWLPQYLVEVHALDPDEALWGYLLPVITLAVVNVVGGWLLRHGLGAGPMLALGMGLQGACWFLLPWTQTGLTGVVSLIVYGAGAGLAPTALFAMPSRILGPGRPLVPAFGIVMTGRNVGVLLGPILLAQLSKLEGGWHLSAPIFGGLSLLAVLLGFWLMRRLGPKS